MSRSSKMSATFRSRWRQAVGLVARPMTTGVATLQILRKELDPNDWWTRMTGKKANDGSQKVYPLSDKQGTTARSQCSCTFQAFCPLRDFQNGIEPSG